MKTLPLWLGHLIAVPIAFVNRGELAKILPPPPCFLHK